jgi:S1 RNA binding domain protein
MPIELGAVVEGSIAKLTPYGVLVNLPGGDAGLVHISEIADAYVHDVADYFQVGDAVKVKVLNRNDKGRYELSAKQVEPRQPINPAAVAAPRPRPRRSGRADPEFEDRLSSFIKNSEKRLSDLKRNRDARRRGRRRR